MPVVPLDGGHVASILAGFGLGSWGRLSEGPVASGRLGSVWRLDTECGSWAVKQVDNTSEEELAGVFEGAEFQEAAHGAGVPTPAVRRMRAGELLARCDGVRARLHAWVDLLPPDPGLDAVEVGNLVAGPHRVEFVGAVGLDEWYTAAIGEARWSALIAALRGRRASFADELELLVPELLAMEAFLGQPPRALRTCHRDLWADNVRRVGDGGLCVFDFDNAGLADPSQELAAVLVEYCADPRRASVVRAAYAEAGGPGERREPDGLRDAIAQLSHILLEGCRRWLTARTDARLLLPRRPPAAGRPREDRALRTPPPCASCSWNVGCRLTSSRISSAIPTAARSSSASPATSPSAGSATGPPLFPA
jgi:Ser/Thr protein kinase RdoA (MazF antagonist)